VIVFLEFVFGLMRFQNINAPYGPISLPLYLLISGVALLIAYYLLSKIGEGTLSPILHQTLFTIITLSIYFSISLFAVLIGYLIINPELNNVRSVTNPELIVGLTVASVYTAILSATIMFQGSIEISKGLSRRNRHIQEWLNAYERAKEVENATHQVEAHERFIEQSELLLNDLEKHGTNEGGQLYREFSNWIDEFQDRGSTISRQDILTGNTKNERLLNKHEKLMCLKRKVERIGGDEL